MNSALTPDDIKNGWTPEALAAYHAEREAAAVIGSDRLVAGNVVTEFQRGKQFPRVESALRHKPHRWMIGR